MILGKVLENHREEGTVVVQPHRGTWSGVAVKYKPYYLGHYGHTTVLCEQVARELVPYTMIAFEASLKANGELSHGTEAKLRSGSWGLYLEEAERISLQTCSYIEKRKIA